MGYKRYTLSAKAWVHGVHACTLHTTRAWVHGVHACTLHTAKAWVHGVHTLYVVEARMHVIHTGTEHDTHTYTQPLMSLRAHETVWV